MINLDEQERTTTVCALLHYALHVADPSECVRALDKVWTHPDGSWQGSIYSARSDFRMLLDTRVAEATA